jgi:hypothetical protein
MSRGRSCLPRRFEFVVGPNHRTCLGYLRVWLVFESSSNGGTGVVPLRRITTKEALQHPWFKESLMDDDTEAHKIRLEREKTTRRQEKERRFRDQESQAY